MIDLMEPAPRQNFPDSWHLSPAKDRILTQLTQKGQASKELIAYLASPIGRGSLDAVKAQISQLRSLLDKQSAPVTIHSVRGWGYRIDRPSQDYLRAFLRERKRKEAA